MVVIYARFRFLHCISQGKFTSTRGNPVVRRIDATNTNWLYVEQRGDDETMQLINASKDGLLDKSRYSVKNGIIHYVISSPDGTHTKPFVPRRSRLGLLRIFHDEQCHVGMDKTIDSIQKHFWFPHMRSTVKKYIKHCLICAVKKT